MKANVYENIVACEDFNSKIKRELHLLPGHLRKYFKLLIKQYRVIEVTQDPPDYQGDIVVRKNPFVVSYQDFHGGPTFKTEIDYD